MTAPICPQCALKLLRAQAPTRWSRELRPRILKRHLMTLQKASETVPRVKEGKIALLHSRLSLPTFESLESLPQTPYITMPVARSFVPTVDRITLPLMRAIVEKNDEEWWKEYTSLVESAQIHRISRSQYNQIMRAFHPKYFFANFSLAGKLDFVRRINAVKEDMKTRGFTLSQVEWAHVLDCGRAMGSPYLTQKWWKEMLASGVEPDIYCYNNYLAAVCGMAASLQIERGLEFKTDKDGNIISLGRSISKSPRPMQRYPKLGRSKMATDIVQQMLSKSNSPTAHTYELLIVAHARDNNDSAINDIVQEIWGVNPDGTSTSSPPAAASPGSPLRPSQHTLNALTNAYGFNGDIKTALAVINAISERYNIIIPVSTWLALLLWASRCSTVHRRPRYGFLSPLAAPRIFQIMTSPPYNVSPGTEGYWCIIQHQMRRRAFGSVERLLVEALKRYGPNGTDLPPEMAGMEKVTLAGVKNWVPILCERVAQKGDLKRAKEIWRRWQQRFQNLHETGLLRLWDEVDESRKSKVEGIILPPATWEPTSLSIRRRLAARHKKEYLNRRKARRLMFLRGMGELELSRRVFGMPGFMTRAYDFWVKQAWGSFGEKEPLWKVQMRKRQEARERWMAARQKEEAARAVEDKAVSEAQKKRQAREEWIAAREEARRKEEDPQVVEQRTVELQKKREAREEWITTMGEVQKMEKEHLDGIKAQILSSKGSKPGDR